MKFTKNKEALLYYGIKTVTLKDIRSSISSEHKCQLEPFLQKEA